jgi:hypothetical protein
MMPMKTVKPFPAVGRPLSVGLWKILCVTVDTVVTMNSLTVMDSIFQEEDILDMGIMMMMFAQEDVTVTTMMMIRI